MRTLTEAEVENALNGNGSLGAPDFLDRLEGIAEGALEPAVAALEPGEASLRNILTRAMRGGYPVGRLGNADKRHDFFHDLIRLSAKTDLPAVSRIRDALVMRRVYRVIGARSGERLKTSEVASILDLRRQMTKLCTEALMSLQLVAEQPAWTGDMLLARTIRSPILRVTDSGWLCGLLGFCWANPDALGPADAPIVRRILNGWVWAQLEAFVDNDPDRRLSHWALREGASVSLLVENKRTNCLIAAETTPETTASGIEFDSMRKLRSLLEKQTSNENGEAAQPPRLISVVFTTGDRIERVGKDEFTVPMALLWH